MEKVKNFVLKFFWNYPLFGFFCIVMLIILVIAITGSISVFFIGMEENESAIMEGGMIGYLICFFVFLILVLLIRKKFLKL